MVAGAEAIRETVYEETVKFGIDVSKWDVKPLDWTKAVMDFIVVKVSEGIVEDKLFKPQWNAARGNTLRAAYHFFRPSVDPTVAAKKMLDILGHDLGEMPTVLDLETTDGRTDTLDRAKTWCAVVEEETGLKPIIYSTIPFMKENGSTKKTLGLVWKHAWLKDTTFWLAQYPYDLWPDEMRDARIENIMNGDFFVEMPSVDILPPLKTQIWQWTARGKPEQVAGYYDGFGGKKAIDFNFANDKWLGQYSFFNNPPASLFAQFDEEVRYTEVK